MDGWLSDEKRQEEDFGVLALEALSLRALFILELSWGCCWLEIIEASIVSVAQL